MIPNYENSVILLAQAYAEFLKRYVKRRLKLPEVAIGFDGIGAATIKCGFDSCSVKSAAKKLADMCCDCDVFGVSDVESLAGAYTPPMLGMIRCVAQYDIHTDTYFTRLYAYGKKSTNGSGE